MPLQHTERNQFPLQHSMYTGEGGNTFGRGDLKFNEADKGRQTAQGRVLLTLVHPCTVPIAPSLKKKQKPKKQKKNTAGAWKSSQHPPRLLAHASGTAAKLPRSLEVGSEYPCSQLCLGLWENRRGQSHMVCDGVGLLGISRAKPASPADIGCFPFSLLRGTCRWSVLSLAFYPLLSASHCATQGDARGSSTIQLLATNQLALPLLSGSSSSSWLCAGEGQHT